MHHTMSRLTRRSLLHGSLLSLAAVSPLRTLLVQDVAASKKGKKRAESIAKRVKGFQDMCGVIGGTSSPPDVRPGGTTVSCTTSDSTRTCTYTSKGSRCTETAARTEPDGPDQPRQPDSPFADPGDVPDYPLEPDGGGVTLT